jgi:glucose dehydrogenase
MVAVDLKAGKILWRSRVGTTEDRAPLGIAFHWGTPLVNGVAITAGGLAFTGAMDAYLRAFDAKSGEELWQGRLPVPGVANPMTYLWKGEQYVAIGASQPTRVQVSPPRRDSRGPDTASLSKIERQPGYLPMRTTGTWPNTRSSNSGFK